MEPLTPLVRLDWAVIVLFFIVTLAIGLYFSRRATTTLADYFVAGRKMTWWVAGTSIVATAFAADTPLVISGWMRTIGLERNWFWWGGIMGFMLCTFFFARLWRRAGVLTDVEFNELRYSGVPAAGLRIFHASYRSLIQNTLVMGWVTLAMTKILDVTLDIPTLVFVKDQWFPILVRKGMDVASVVDAADISIWPLIGQAVISAKATGIIICFSVAALYSTISGLWGVMATDFFQFTFAMTGTVILMFVVLGVAGGPSHMVQKAELSVDQGLVINQTPKDRKSVSEKALLKALGWQMDNPSVDLDVAQSGVGRLLALGVFVRSDKAADQLLWTIPGKTRADLETLLETTDPVKAAKEGVLETLPFQALPDKTMAEVRVLLENAQLTSIEQAREKGGLFELWASAYTIGRSAFTDSKIVNKLLAGGVMVEDFDASGKALEYFRLPNLSLSEEELQSQLGESNIKARSEIMAAWRCDKVVSTSKITGFLPPFDLKGGALLAVWSIVVFLGLQWWAGGSGDGFLAQRLFSCKNEKHSVFAMLWFNFANFVLRPWPWIVVGVASLFLIPDVTAYGAHYNEEHAYVIMLMKFLPVGLKGLMVAALMAAYMSTISTHVNFGASYVVNDIYKRFLHKGASERASVIASQVATVFLAILAGAYAYLSESIGTAWMTYFELMSGAGLVMLVRWYWWRVNAWSEIAAMTASLCMFLLLNHTELFHGMFAIVGIPEYFLGDYAVRFTLNLLISTTIWLSVTFLTPPEKSDHLVRFYRRVRPAGLWSRVAEDAGVQDHLVVGRLEWSCWALGTTGLFAMIFSVGNACFGKLTYSLGFGIYAIIATYILFKLLGKMDWTEMEKEEDSDEPTTAPA